MKQFPLLLVLKFHLLASQSNSLTLPLPSGKMITESLRDEKTSKTIKSNHLQAQTLTYKSSPKMYLLKIS